MEVAPAVRSSRISDASDFNKHPNRRTPQQIIGRRFDAVKAHDTFLVYCGVMVELLRDISTATPTHARTSVAPRGWDPMIRRI